MSTYHHLPTYLPLPIPKYQYIIAADPGAGIGLVVVVVVGGGILLNGFHCFCEEEAAAKLLKEEEEGILISSPREKSPWGKNGGSEMCKNS